jgi:D-xylose transport system permease protein
VTGGPATAVLSVNSGLAGELAIVAGLLTGLAIGLVNGFFVTQVGVPSFVVTLAGLIAWQGALLAVLGDTGAVNLRSGPVTDLAGTFFEPAVGWAGLAVVLAGYVGWLALRRRRKAAHGLEPESRARLAARLVAVAAALTAAVAVLNADRGVPLAAAILVGTVALFAFITANTRFGRHIYAVGGSAEAARRAGIRVERVRVVVFALTSMLAAAGGILAASRLLAVNQSSGGGDLLLEAIAGPVIAGVSLFGGRGTVWAALIGALVIGSISNGMDLLALESEVKFMVTGAVLLFAVSVDAIARRRGESG